MSSYFFNGIGLRDTNKDDGWHVEWPNMDVSARFWKCEFQNSWGDDLIFPVRKGKHCTMPFPDMPISQPVPVCCDRVKMLFERIAPKDLQFLPIALEYKGKKMGDSPYWIMNLLRLVDCVDETQSNWSIGYGGFKTYRSWIMDKSRIPTDASVFRVVGAEYPVVVTEAVRCEVEQATITGVGFLELGYLGMRGSNWEPGLSK